MLKSLIFLFFLVIASFVFPSLVNAQTSPYSCPGLGLNGVCGGTSLCQTITQTRKLTYPNTTFECAGWINPNLSAAKPPVTYLISGRTSPDCTNETFCYKDPSANYYIVANPAPEIPQPTATPTPKPAATATPTPLPQNTGTGTTCSSNGVKSTSYASGCTIPWYTRSATVICNDGTTKTFTAYTCYDKSRFSLDILNFCYSHKACPTPTSAENPTNTPTPLPQATATFTPVPICDPDPVGASAGKLDMADFLIWKSEFLAVPVITNPKAGCLKPDNKLDLLDFQVWKNKSFNLL